MARNRTHRRMVMRAVLASLVIAGLFGMHEIASLPSAAADAMATGMTMPAAAVAAPAATRGCCTPGHPMLHLCTSVLPYPVPSLLLAMVSVAITAGAQAALAVRGRSMRRRRGRAPPPSTLSLAQLSILRV